MATLTNWIRKNVVSRYLMTSCPHEQQCLHALEVILDDESSPEEATDYYKHLEKCWPCYQNYNLEKTIRELIKNKIDKKPVPDDLVRKIRGEIEKLNH